MKIFAYSKWDAVAVTAGVLHFAYVVTFFFIFPYAPWWVLICMGCLYSVSVSWNINGVSHNLIHNPFFKSRLLNRLFSIMESVTLGISQTFYKYVHHRHHLGNSDRPDEHGNTYDWISIYRHGRDGKAENPRQDKIAIPNGGVGDRRKIERRLEIRQTFRQPEEVRSS